MLTTRTELLPPLMRIFAIREQVVNSPASLNRPALNIGKKV